MPRGRKKKESLTIDQQIEKVTAEITELMGQVKEKKAELKNLEAAKKSQMLAALSKAIRESGKSAEEVLEILRKE